MAKIQQIKDKSSNNEIIYPITKTKAVYDDNNNKLDTILDEKIGIGSQSFTEEEKTIARNNIGAGTSNFSGSYTDLTDKPSIPSKTSELTNDSGFSSVSASASGTATDEVKYITIDGTEKKIAQTTSLAASAVTAGTFAGQTNANATSVQTLDTAQVRNIIISTTDLTPGTSALATGDVYIVYGD